MDNDQSFLGRGWSFPPEFSREESPLKLVGGEDDIRQSLIILLSTYVGERVYRKNYGAGLREFQFEQMDLTQETLLIRFLEKKILLFEPRIRVNTIRTDHTREKEGVLQIEIDYTVRLSNSSQNLVYPYYLNK